MEFNRNSSTGSTPRSSSAASEECLSQINMEEHYSVLRELGSGTYGQSILAQCRATDKQIAIKLMKKSTTKFVDFLREFQMSYFLSPHPAIVSSYDVAFETPSHFAFAQEYAAFGDLFDCIEPQRGLTENSVKLITTHLVSALDFMHSKGIVHRDVKPENVLIFNPDFSRVKLVDFGMTRHVGTLIRKTGDGIPYTPPEISQKRYQDTYVAHPSADVWALGVLMFSCLTGNFPWELATEDDPHYHAYLNYHSKGSTILTSWSKPPAQFSRIAPRLMHLLSRMLEPRPEKRCQVTELRKYLNLNWLRSGGRRRTASSSLALVEGEEFSFNKSSSLLTADDRLLCRPPMFGEDHFLHSDSVSSSGELPSKLEWMLSKCGVQTKVNSKTREKRIYDWVFRSSDKRTSESST